MEALVVFLLCALCISIYFTNKYKDEVVRLKEKLREQENLSASRIEPNLPTTKKFVSVSFKEGDTQVYDYLIGDNYDLKVDDLVEVPFRSKYSGENEVKIATVKYVSVPGEQSNFARSNVIRKVDSPTQTAKKFTSGKKFVNVIFEEGAKRSYSYLVGDFEVKVGDFVVVPISDRDSGQSKLKSAKVVYISAPGEVSSYAKSQIMKKADYDEW